MEGLLAIVGQIKKSCEMMDNLGSGVISIDYHDRSLRVHVFNKNTFDALPGDAEIYAGDAGDKYVDQYVKRIDGVEFFTVVGTRNKEVV